MGKDDVRRRILIKAGEIFATSGYQGATIREICQMADVNVAAVNYYFGDKERLYIDAVKHARSMIEARWPLPEWSDSATAEQKLSMFVRTFTHRLLSHETAEWQLRLILREVLEPTRACEEMVQESFRPFFQVLLDILGEFLPSDTPDHRVKQVGFSIVSQCMFYLAHKRVVRLIVDDDDFQSYFDAETLSEHIVSFSLAALQGLARERNNIRLSSS